MLSRLGESINIIFGNARQKKNIHTLEKEWQLVENVIIIHKTMYIPELETVLPDNNLLHKYSNMLIPMGLLEISAENALLHGLRNKSEKPYVLSISVKDTDDSLIFTIEDNGIGRTAAKQLSSFKNNGTGIQYINDLIHILNKPNRKKIEIEFEGRF